MIERELIEYIRELTARDEPAWLKVGLGDDAAVIEPPGGGGGCLVITTDTVVEGVHFEPGTEPRLVGWKAMARGVSDLAAMAARPLCTLAAAHFPPGLSDAAARDLVRALVEAARTLSAPLVGGDTAAGADRLSVAVTAVGTPGPKGAITRAGARPGDAVCVTGELGGAMAGRHLTFRPRVEEALELAERCDVHALIDVSDGLSTDALHVAEAGGVGLALRAADIPVSAAATEMAARDGRQPLQHALADGEDYELLFCLPPVQAERLLETGLGELAVSLIGEVTDGPESCLLMPDGRREPLRAEGWEHRT